MTSLHSNKRCFIQQKMELAYYEFTQSLKMITINSEKEYERLNKSQPMIVRYHRGPHNQSIDTKDSIKFKNSNDTISITSPPVNPAKSTSPFDAPKNDTKWSLEHPQLNMLKKQKTLFSSSGEINKMWPEHANLKPPSTFSPMEESDLKVS